MSERREEVQDKEVNKRLTKKRKWDSHQPQKGNEEVDLDHLSKKKKRKERRKEKRKARREKKHEKWKSKLFVAVEQGDKRRVEKLIDQRSGRHIKDYLAEWNNDGLAAIHVAAARGYWQICQLLLYHGCDIDTLSADGCSSLHYACLNEHYDTVAFFVKNSADKDLPNRLGIKPTDLGLARLLRKAEEAALLRRLEKEFEEELRNERERELQEQREWQEKLAQEAGEENPYWQETWAREDMEREREKKVEDMTDEEWRYHIVHEMRKKKAPQYAPSDYAKKKQEEKERQDKFNAYVSEKIAEEERRKEAIRAQHRVQSQQQQAEDLEEKWKQFEATISDDSFGPKPKIRLRDIPFPNIEQDEKSGSTLGGFDVLTERLTIPEKKKVLRELFLRWHPDKFEQRYGQLFHPTDKEAIMEQVTRITQQIAKIKDVLNSLEAN